MAASKSCHSASNYSDCMRSVFNEGTASGAADAITHYMLITSITICILLLVAGWMFLDIYNAWGNGNLKFNQLMNTLVRIILILTISIYLIVN